MPFSSSNMVLWHVCWLSELSCVFFEDEVNGLFEFAVREIKCFVSVGLVYLRKKNSNNHIFRAIQDGFLFGCHCVLCLYYMLRLRHQAGIGNISRYCMKSKRSIPKNNWTCLFSGIANPWAVSLELWAFRAHSSRKFHSPFAMSGW
jgi:hypothetical protein